ncbi:MAG: DUF5071 domain-containing protein [Anaerolineae bacterium]|nr:DUF5071 domain-containing protein [Anaerolineae bacterium]
MIDKSSPEYAELARLYQAVGGIDGVPAALLEYLPRDKHDDDCVKRIAALEPSTVEPLLLHVLTWLQDLNWPIARVAADYLRTGPMRGAPLIGPVRFVLNTGESDWKYWVLLELVEHWPRALVQQIEEDLRRHVTAPTQDDIEEDVPEIAQEILAQHDL